MYLPVISTQMEVQRLSNGQAIRSTLVILLFFSFFNWRIIVLQCCGSLCHTSTGISHTFVYTSLLPLEPPSSSHPTPRGHYECEAGLPVLYSSFLRLIYLTLGSIYVSATLSISPALSFPGHAHKSVLYVFVSISSL